MIQHFRFHTSPREPIYDFCFKDRRLYSLHILTAHSNENTQEQHQYRYPLDSQQAIQTDTFKAAIDTVCKDRTCRYFDSFFEYLKNDIEYYNIAREKILEEICYMSDKLNSFCKAYNVCTH